MTGVPTNCLTLATHEATRHVQGLPTAGEVSSFCHLARVLRQKDFWVLTHQHWAGALLPTGLCLRLHGLNHHTTSAVRFTQALYQAQRTRRRYAVIVLSTATMMYGLREGWAHAIAFLGFTDFRVRVYDPLSQIDPELTVRLQPRTVEEYIGNISAICALIQESP